LRSEGDGLLEALDEALRVGREARIGVHVFHLKAAGPRNHDKAARAIERIRAARASGQDVCADAYPYLHNGLDLRSFVHPRRSAAGPEELLAALADARARAEIRREMEEEKGWENWYAHAGSDWDNVILGRIADPALAAHGGASVAALAREVGEDPWQLFFRLSRSGAFAMPRTMSEACVVEILRQDFVAFCTDLGPAWGTSDLTHPRGCGSFARVLARYVRDLGILSLEDAVRRMTSLAANEILAHDRGRLAPGLPADLAVFDGAAIRDRSTFEEPSLLSEGVRFVIVNGTVVFEEGRYTGALPGRVLRRPGGR
jgi:N-acyl-D-aspartate/D-glutamate deacylase